VRSGRIGAGEAAVFGLQAQGSAASPAQSARVVGASMPVQTARLPKGSGRARAYAYLKFVRRMSDAFALSTKSIPTIPYRPGAAPVK
jgi:hypothetical protein